MLRATLLAFAVCFSAASAVAQEGVLAELYGQGVHHYYSGQYDAAHRYLSMAIDNGSRDPRAYYFRGLVHDATGRQQEAEADYRMGAQQEVENAASSSVSRALTRIQGTQRLEIEAIRDEVRLQERATQAAQAQMRYQQREAADASVQRQPRAAAPTARAPVPVQPPATPPGDRENPFADDAAIAVGEPQVDAEDAMPPVTDQPAAAGAAAAASPAAANGNVFGGAPADPVGGDLFGGAAAPGGAAPGGDPFGGAAAPGGAAPSGDPFGGAAAPGGAAPSGDPFGAGSPFGTPAPADAPPAADDVMQAPAADAMQAPAADDPFSTGGDDPFAN